MRRKLWGVGMKTPWHPGYVDASTYVSGWLKTNHFWIKFSHRHHACWLFSFRWRRYQGHSRFLAAPAGKQDFFNRPNSGKWMWIAMWNTVGFSVCSVNLHRAKWQPIGRRLHWKFRGYCPPLTTLKFRNGRFVQMQRGNTSKNLSIITICNSISHGIAIVILVHRSFSDSGSERAKPSTTCLELNERWNSCSLVLKTQTAELRNYNFRTSVLFEVWMIDLWNNLWLPNCHLL